MSALQHKLQVPKGAGGKKLNSPWGVRGPSAPADQVYLRAGEAASPKSEDAREVAEERLRRLLRATRTCSTIALCKWTCAAQMAGQRMLLPGQVCCHSLGVSAAHLA